MTTHLIRTFWLAAGLCVAAMTQATAQQSFDNIVSAEILPGWETPGGGQMAGLRLTLAPGWKTYWRAPGGGGIPPSFDWTGSENLGSVTLHWPRPTVYVQNGLRSIAYKHEVVLPLEITARKPGQPVTLNGRVELGVCQDVCVPVELRLHADLSGRSDAAPIRAALAARPTPGDQAGVGAVRCTTQPISDGLRLTAKVAVPALGPAETAVVELADPSVWIAEAEVSRDGDTLTAVTDLVPESEAPFDLNGADVRITLLSGSTAIDIKGCAID